MRAQFDDILATLPTRRALPSTSRNTNCRNCGRGGCAVHGAARVDAALPGPRAISATGLRRERVVAHVGLSLRHQRASLFPRQHLFRQARGQGRKIFWSRGNGWVMGGLVRRCNTCRRIIPARPRFERQFKEMAAARPEMPAGGRAVALESAGSGRIIRSRRPAAPASTATRWRGA